MLVFRRKVKRRSDPLETVVIRKDGAVVATIILVDAHDGAARFGIQARAEMPDYMKSHQNFLTGRNLTCLDH